MSEYIVQCPCCKNKMKILVDSSGYATASISQVELYNEFGIELGVLNNEEK